MLILPFFMWYCQEKSKASKYFLLKNAIMFIAMEKYSRAIVSKLQFVLTLKSLHFKIRMGEKTAG